MNIKYITIIILAALLTLLGCQKELTNIDNPTKQITADQLLEARILAFQEITQHPTKNGTTTTVDSALWYAEALLNYTYATPIETLNGVTRLCDTFSIAATGDALTQTEVAEFYAQVNTFVEGALPSNELFVYADIERVTDGLKNGEVTYSVTSGFTFGLPYTTYGINDWWHSHWEEGKCNGYSGYDDVYDAADIIAMVANSRRGGIGGGYFTDIEYCDIASEPASPSDTYYYSNPYGYYNHYMFGQNNSDECLSPEEMEFYTQRLMEMTDIVQANIYPNRLIVAYFAYDDLMGSYPNARYVHTNHSSFGIFHKYSNED